MRLGPYEVVRAVGHGASGAVFEARACRLDPAGPPPREGHRVAIKLITRRGAGAMARFERERRLLADLAGAGGIVPILDAGSSREGDWVAMPFIAGGTLRDRLTGPGLGVEATLGLARVLVATVARCHARGVVHRDLKPENVLLDQDGAPLVADLGLAKHYAADTPGASLSAVLSSTGELRGTAGYAAPEQLHDAKAVGPPADVFALGAIIYECLAGVPAFRGDSALDVFKLVDEGCVEPLEEACPEAPRWLIDVVHRALEVDPAARYPDAAALLEALEEPAAPPTGPSRARLLVAGGALVVLLLGVVAGAVLRAASAPAAAPGAAGPAPATATAAPPPAPLAAPEAAAPTRAQQARDWVEKARVQLLALEFRAAARDFEKATQLDPGLAAAWAGRAWALEAYSHHDASLEPLRFAEKAVELAPGAADSWIARSFARAREEPRGAIEDARHAVALAPRDPQAHVALAHALGMADGWPAAQGSLQDALALDPTEPHALLLRALGAVEAGELARVEADVRVLLRRAPRSHLALRLLARAREEQGDIDGAVKALRDATQADPEDPRAWHELGITLKDPAEQEAALTRCLELGYTHGSARRLRGEARLRLQDFRGAQDDLELACQEEVKNPHAWFSLGQAYLAQRQAEPATIAFQRAVDLDPRVAPAWVYLAEAYAIRRKFKKALAALDEAVKLTPNEPPLHFGRGQLLTELKDRPGAIAALERFLALAGPLTPRVDEARAMLEKLRATE